jgi:hypothetical protein
MFKIAEQFLVGLISFIIFTTIICLSLFTIYRYWAFFIGVALGISLAYCCVLIGRDVIKALKND